MTANQRRSLIRFIIGVVLFIVSIIVLEGKPIWLQLIVSLLIYLFVGFDVILSAFKNILKRQLLDEKFLMTIASVGAFFLQEYHEAIAVMLFYQIGEWFQDFAVDKSRKNIEELLEICPDSAIVIRNGSETIVTPEEVIVGETVLIRPGERIPVDCRVVSGNSSLDTSALSGESAPVDVSTGDEVLSGSINLTGFLTLECIRAYENSTVSRILELVENATDQKASSEDFITRFSSYYTPIVVISALLLSFLPPLIIGDSFSVWIHRALTFLVVSCPCALVVSVPLTFFSSIGSASRRGVLIKGSQAIETMAKIDTIAFDKTGTLTMGRFTVTEIVPFNCSKDHLLETAAHIEAFSTHPIAQSISQAFSGQIARSRITDIREVPGRGISALFDGNRYYVGNELFLSECGIVMPSDISKGLYSVHISNKTEYLGYIVIEDTLKESAPDTLKELKETGISRLALLTGDTPEAANRIAAKLPLDIIESHLLPDDKVEKIHEFQKNNHIVCFVGDGMNDAPVLASADVGIAMGGLGSDAAIEASDIVLMNDRLEEIGSVLRLSRKTMRIVKENIIISLASKLIVLFTGALGITGMNMAVFADVGILCICVLNALRTLRNR